MNDVSDVASSPETGYAVSIGRVLVGIDGSAAARTALSAALEEAVSWNVPLRLVSVVEPSTFAPMLDESLERSAREIVDTARAKAAARLGDDRVSVHVEVGRAHTVLLHEARADDLIVVGTHSHRLATQLIIGSTSAALAAHAPCPVLVVRGPVTHPQGPVVVGVDGSAASTGAVSFAAAMAHHRRASLRAVAAVAPIIDAYGITSGPDAPEIDAAEQQLKAAVADIRKQYPELAIETVVNQLHPVSALEAQSMMAQLLVVGSRGRGTLASVFLGSVSRGLLHSARCPVAVARTRVSEGVDPDDLISDTAAGR